MAEVDADALGVQIQEARDAGDDEKAQALYQRQQGTEDAHSLEPAAPAVVGGDGDAPPQTGSSDLVVATDAQDQTATITGGMDFAGNPEHTAHALACMEVWGGDEVAQLKAKWGSDMGANLGFFQAFALAHPDIHEILVASGFGDHPAIIEVGAILGRRYATQAGDPGQITTKKAGVKALEPMATNQIEAQIESYQDDIDTALARNDRDKAQQLFTAQQELYRRLPGGSEPLVGRGGRVT